MNKLLGLLVLGLAFSLTIGTIGCQNKDKDKDKKVVEKDAKEKDVKEKDVKEKDVKTDKDTKTDKDAKTDKDTKTDKTKPKVEDVTATVEFKEIKNQTTKASGDQTVKVELTKVAPADLTIKGSVNKVEDKIVHATGSIKKGESSGDLVITTKDAPVGMHTVDLVISGEKAAGKGSFKLEVK